MLTRSSIRRLSDGPSRKALEQEQQTVLSHYNRSMTDLRRSLIQAGVHNDTTENMKQKKIQANIAKLRAVVVQNSRSVKAEENAKKHALFLQVQAEENARREKQRVGRSVNKYVHKLQREEDELRANIALLAKDVEVTWNKDVKEDMKHVVPVNAAFLGVLPKRHAHESTEYADYPFDLLHMYGPPPISEAGGKAQELDPRLEPLAKFTKGGGDF